MDTPDPQQFLETVAPVFRGGNIEQLRADVLRHWQPGQVSTLLHAQDADLRQTAAVVLGVVGDREVIGSLTRALHDPDERVHRHAEDAIWSIWFRIGRPAAARHFQRGTAQLEEENYDQAADAFAIAAYHDPQFAEAYNQLAISYYLDQQWTRSRSACYRTLALMPMHFGALAGLGHVHAHRGEYPQAIAAYRRALAINPRMPSVIETKAKLEDQHPTLSPDAPETRLLHFDTPKPTDPPANP